MCRFFVLLICFKIISAEITYNSDQRIVSCVPDDDGFEDMSDMIDASSDVTHINVASCKIVDLPSDRFRGFNKLVSVNFSSNYISRLNDNTFVQSIETIDFSKNAISFLEPLVFTALPNLIYLDLSDNLLFLHSFGAVMMGKTKNLNLILDGNNPNFNSIQVSSSDGSIQGTDTIIQRIVISALSDKLNDQTMTDVKLKNMLSNDAIKLSLRNNNLISLPQDIFYKCRKVYYLKLAHNKLQSLHPDIFSKNIILRLLHLHNNQLDYLHDNMFRMNKKIIFINLDNNRLKNINSQLFRPLVELKVLRMANNMISHISDSSFNSNIEMVSLDLSGNDLRQLDLSVFARNALIKGLDFSGNKLESFPYEMVASMNGLKQLRLHNNKLDSIDQEFFDNDIEQLSIFCNKLHSFPTSGKIKVDSLYFHGNPWRCGCLNRIMLNINKYRLAGATSSANPMVCIAGKNVSICDDQPLNNKDFITWSKAQSSYPDACHPSLEPILNYL